MARKVRLTVWSDYVCPFCYLEEPVLDRIREEYEGAVDVAWRAFELRPAPVPTLDPDGDYLHSVWNRAVYPMARQSGMVLRLPPVQPRSRKALELAELARENGRFDEAHRALFKAFFEDGRDLDNVDVLAEIGAAVGLDSAEVRAALEQGTYRERVISDEQLAAQLGINAVPTVMIHATDEPLEKAEALSGAQPYQVVKAVVERVMRRE
jgi:predicted DsbA family dithiol-disulfide isomerase